MPKIVTILGATGMQGSSVLRSFLADTDENWHIRAITRNPDSAQAKSVQALSPGRITLQRGDTTSQTDVISAMRGAAVVYAMTDYWAPFSSDQARAEHPTGLGLRKFAYDEEIRMGKIIVDAAATVLAESPTTTTNGESGLERFVLSSEPSPAQISAGRYRGIYHFESKAEIARYLRKTHAELAKRTSLLYVGFYVSNMLKMRPMWPVRLADGSFVVQRLCDGDAKLPFIITEEDTGPHVHAMVNRRKGQQGEVGDELPVLAYTAMLGWADLARLWGEATGQKVAFQRVSLQEFQRHFPVEGEELLSAPYAAEFGFAGRDGFVEPSELGLAADEGRVREWFRKQDWSAVLDAPARKSVE